MLGKILSCLKIQFVFEPGLLEKKLSVKRLVRTWGWKVQFLVLSAYRGHNAFASRIKTYIHSTYNVSSQAGHILATFAAFVAHLTHELFERQ